MTTEERLDALAEALAEGFLHLAMTGQLEEVLSDRNDEDVKANIPVVGKKADNELKMP